MRVGLFLFLFCFVLFFCFLLLFYQNCKRVKDEQVDSVSSYMKKVYSMIF